MVSTAALGTRVDPLTAKNSFQQWQRNTPVFGWVLYEPVSDALSAERFEIDRIMEACRRRSKNVAPGGSCVGGVKT